MSKGWNEDDIVCAFDNLCLSNNPDVDLTDMVPWNHEEADSRIFWHVTHMAIKGHSEVMINIVDKDVQK